MESVQVNEPEVTFIRDEEIEISEEQLIITVSRSKVFEDDYSKR